MTTEQQKIKILYVITKSNWGGAQRYVYDLATRAPKDYFEVFVALGGNGPLKEKLDSAGIQTFSIDGLARDINIFKEISAFFQLLSILKKTRPNIVHLNSSKAGALGGLAARLYNFYIFFLRMFHVPCSMLHVQIVFTAHGWAFKEKRSALSKKIIEYISWFTVVLSHVTIVVSKDDREKIKHFLFIQSKIKVIYNGIELPTFKEKNAARDILSEKIGFKPNENCLWIGTIAELTKNKGIEYAIDGVAKLVHNETSKKIGSEEIVYLIIGGGEEREALEKIREREKLEKHVFFVGEYRGASELLKAFDIFLLPSLKEGLPYTLLEAGAASLPTIATNVGGVTEIIEDMKSGVVIKSKRSKEIAEAIGFLIEHSDKRESFGAELQKSVRTEFTLERMVKNTIAVYETV